MRDLGMLGQKAGAYGFMTYRLVNLDPIAGSAQRS